MQHVDGLSRSPLVQEEPSPDEEYLASVWDGEVESVSDGIPDPEEVDSPKPETIIIDCNIARRDFISASACSRCGGPASEGRAYCCAGCRKVVHARCLPGRPPRTYWFCEDCTPTLRPEDPAQDLELQAWLAGGPKPERATEQEAEQLLQDFSYVRG